MLGGIYILRTSSVVGLNDFVRVETGISDSRSLARDGGVDPNLWRAAGDPTGRARARPVLFAGTRSATILRRTFGRYCRFLVVHSRAFGRSRLGVPDRRAWFLQNSENRTWPVASLKPNDAGLFDTLGNAIERCNDEYREYPANGTSAVEDTLDSSPVMDNGSPLLRGGSYYNPAPRIRPAYRVVERTGSRVIYVGFRVARTFP